MKNTNRHVIRSRSFLTGAAFAALLAGFTLDPSAFHKGGFAQAQDVVPGSTMVPQFEVDPLWPKPLPNGWVFGSVIGLSMDAHHNIWIVHRPGSLDKEIPPVQEAKRAAARRLRTSWNSTKPAMCCITLARPRAMIGRRRTMASPSIKTAMFGWAPMAQPNLVLLPEARRSSRRGACWSAGRGRRRKRHLSRQLPPEIHAGREV